MNISVTAPLKDGMLVLLSSIGGVCLWLSSHFYTTHQYLIDQVASIAATVDSGASLFYTRKLSDSAFQKLL